MKKTIKYAVDFVLIVGTLFLLIFLVGYSQPLVIAPLNGLETTENSVLFSFEKADTILIDDNIEFSSPEKIYVKDNLIVNLKPGIYYWKVQGVTQGEIRKLTIESEVDLKLKEKESEQGVYDIVNAGNTVLDVGVYDKDSLQETISLGVDDSAEVSGTKFIGGMKDE